MYSHSKLLQKISDKIDTMVGTEQGHPMSPELFKCYISDLSLELNEELQLMNVPMLNGNKISYLLYVDDLVLLALDAECLQNLISKLEVFCSCWGLTVNETKTKLWSLTPKEECLTAVMDLSLDQILFKQPKVTRILALRLTSVVPSRIPWTH